ncbi:iron complex outermembrane receptor protein [Pelomonas saccharophila]|uniref:Iron complex outermembrane receptor protein n=1 Tax=Roseateles saccharophilus TaxID=304 RepID=A0ABU1YMU8_ROSSA|nr:TonB-dependent receptor [Roseateles saccharophilus]MDR7270188.1 iron complex outermembrane receptor protein [Roseateles saccharophilus]
MKLNRLAAQLAVVGLAAHTGAVLAQNEGTRLERVEITGSSIKRLKDEGALPIQVISRRELERAGIASAEQMIMQLNINGNGLDNLAGNADVVDGAARGNNGASSANLRGQGSNATLILLNGRRVAAHGLNGGTVDLNQIPFAALDRVEILKDGASAIYGTDAIGGVINFILRQNYSGLTINTLADVPQKKGGEIYGASVTAGFGDLNSNGFNFLASLSVQDNKVLRGDQRDFVNTYQPDRGLAPDTRGAPIATLFGVAGTKENVLTVTMPNGTRSNTAGPVDFANSALRVNGINVLDLPGGAGCSSVDGMSPYQEALWATAASKYGCAWDTGRAAVIQQPIKNTNLVSRMTFKLGDHQIFGEAVLGRAESAKSFSPNQITSGTNTSTTSLPNGTVVASPFRDLRYPSTGASYNQIFDALVKSFPELAGNRGLGMAFRWRCMICGNREIDTKADTARYLIGADGSLPFFQDWDYRVGFSRAESKGSSVIGSGYHYWQPFANLINNGTLNPFSLQQSPEAIKALDAISATGVTLYGGKFTMQQADATVSGPLFKLPGGTVMAAIGVDSRTEKYKFDGDQRPNANTVDALIFNVPFDNALATAGTLKRTIKAVFTEVAVPIMKNMEITGAVRRDEYTGFGSTTNPKISIRYNPTEQLLFRGAYSTGFRVPTFKQMFDPVTQSTFVGADFTDPATCPTRVVSNAPGCASVRDFTTLFGGKATLGPEEAKMYSAGMVLQPTKDLVASLDWWSVRREGTIQSFGLTTLADNYQYFQDNFIRDASGKIVAVDTRYVNAGETLTKGLEASVRGSMNALGAAWTGSFDVSYLLDKKSRLVPSAPMGSSEVGRFTRAGDLGIRWKHTATLTRSEGNWAATVQHVYRTGYQDFVLPGVANGSVKPANWNPRVSPYSVINTSLAWSGIKNLTITAGIKNLLNEDPPFSVTYDTNTGAGSSWEPRVADPRGRAYTLRVEYRMF